MFEHTGDMALPVTLKTAAIGSQAPNRLRELREARGLTLAELADRVGTTNQQISHLELGKRQLTVEWLRRLGDALDCHPWAIVEPPRD
jgi:transcriptional regulator with XRE-family HTH domain